MALQVTGGNAGVIGRMFAKRNVQEIYSKQKGAAGETDERMIEAVDTVDLSPFAPKPLAASLFESASGTAAKLTSGASLSPGEVSTLREDRVYAAVAALIAMGTDSESRLPGWPGGLPTPSRYELETAYRRLSQRLENVEATNDPEATQRGRMETIERNRNADFAAWSGRSLSAVAAIWGAS